MARGRNGKRDEGSREEREIMREDGDAMGRVPNPLQAAGFEDAITLEGCQWHTVYNGKTDKKYSISYPGGSLPAQPLEIEVDGKKLEDDLVSPNSTVVEGKKIRLHLKGTKKDFAWVIAEEVKN